jgi:Family of unknown function (DUF6345)
MHRITASALLGAGALLFTALSGTAASAAETTAPVFHVKQEGLSAEQSAQLADAFGVPDSLEQDGAFRFTSDTFAQVPLRQIATGKDESGRPTVSQAIDTRALAALKPLSDGAALEKAGKLVDLAELSPDMTARPAVSHAELTLADRAGTPTSKTPLDTTVSYNLQLAGLPVSGQGAKLRITFAGDGSVTQLSDTLRQLERGADTPILSPDEATAQCAALYDRGVRQATPTLGYVLPALGTVQDIYPSYTCNPSTEQGTQAHLQIPAVDGVAPKAVVKATRAGDDIVASADASGGTGPYTFNWSSSSTTLEETGGSEIRYQRQPRGKDAGEVVTLEVTDVNGLSSTASVSLPTDGSDAAESHPGGGGFGKLAIGPTDVGIEQTVDEWQCAQDSAIGFKAVMSSHAIPTAFDWRGWAAFEKDFKDVTKSGWDTTYVDNVDAQWYTGHGSPSSFTFKASVDDQNVTPSDARWGDWDLEWLQLESCQVLADTNGFHDYFSRWGGTLDGLHILNGFHTNAYCINGGTGRRFAEYLFPAWNRGPLSVRNAWAMMAIDKEPSGVVYRSMGNIATSGATNIGDFFWGQGPTGPDIRLSGRSGMWSITGTV